MTATRIGMLLFPRMTQLDLTGPFEVFSRLPGADVLLLSKTLEPVVADTGLGLLPTATLRDCPPLDVICVPGGPGVNALMEDVEVLDWLRRQAERCALYQLGLQRLAGTRRRRPAARQAGHVALGRARSARRVRRDADRLPRGARRQRVHRWRRHRGHRFRVDDGGRTRRFGSGTRDSAADRIRARATIQCWNAGDGACRCCQCSARSRRCDAHGTRGDRGADFPRCLSAGYSAAGLRCSWSRGISSTRLQGRNRLSSWNTRMSSQASFTAPVLPGSANR